MNTPDPRLLPIDDVAEMCEVLAVFAQRVEAELQEAFYHQGTGKYGRAMDHITRARATARHLRETLARASATITAPAPGSSHGA